MGTTANDEQVFNNNTAGETGTQTDTGFPIGFDFFYNGAIYDRFAVNTNGWIALGTGTFSIGASSAPISSSTSTAFRNIISALGRDLQGQSGSELSYLLSGTAPNRVLVVQWLGYRKLNASSGEDYDFQIRLNENNSVIEFVYGNITTANTSTSTSNNPTQVGIRGLVSSDYKNRTTTSSWSSSSAGTANTYTMRMTTTVKPVTGLTYIFTPAAMSYSSCTADLADTSAVKKNSVNNPVIRIQVVTTGLLTPLSVTSITCKTNGTTSITDISNAKIWFTGTSSIFTADSQFGSVITNPNGSIVFTGTANLKSGTNYFWLTYDVPLIAVTGNAIDGECNSITVGSSKTPSTQAPSGNRKIANSPMSGTYVVGFAAYKLISGKELYYKKLEKIVTIKKHTRNQADGKQLQDNSRYSIYRDLTETEFTVMTDTFILMDGELPYGGPDCIEIDSQLRNKFSNLSRSDEVTGVYSSITSALTDLNKRGVSGPVLFSLSDNEYNSETFPLTINDISGTSSVNTLTIKPAAGTSPQIIMPSGAAIFKITNSNYIIIDGSNSINGSTRDLSLISNYANISNCIWIGSTGTTPVGNITVKYCNLKTGETSLGSTGIMVSDAGVSGNPGFFNNINIQNNFIQKGRQGIYVNGGTDPQNGNSVFIYDNVINSTGSNATGYLGIYMQGINYSVIRGNEVANLNNTSAENDKGIWVANGSTGITIESNRLYSIGYSGSSGNAGYGIYTSSNRLNAGVIIKNNIIYNIYGDGWDHTGTYFLDNPAGIMLYSSSPQSGISIFNNSINLYGNTLTQKSSLSSGIFLTSGSTADIRNNSIVNNLGTASDSAFGSCCIYAQSSAEQFLNIDYNNYYCAPSGNGVKALGKISSNAFLTLGSFSIATGKDRSSLSSNPGYRSPSDLEPDGNSSDSWTLNGRGTQISSVVNDLRGNSRSTSVVNGAPDIGAYEFTPSALPPAALQSGSISNGSTTYYLFGADTIASIKWHGSDLPSAVSTRYYSGSNPPMASTGSFGNCYVTFAPSGGNAYTFDITFFYDPSLIGTIGSENDINLANYSAGSWTHFSSVLNTSARIVTKTGLTQLSTFTIDDEQSPLPVNLKYFTSEVSFRNVILKWATLSEINNYGFDIERRSDADTGWIKRGFIEGNGTISSECMYSFAENDLSAATFSYRLKQLDYNGNAEYFYLGSNVTVNKPLKFDISQNYPNPSNPESKIDFQIPKNAYVSIRVFDITGREVAVLQDSFMDAGFHSVKFEGANLSSGVYFYRILTESFSKTMKLILVK
ncbi:MAG TPA: BNR-repeat neuraminidase N-terminal domain-containing protein [Ignavibacteria bacterium]|nr:BNR-repeat neuraminidase N-terminal domain-containing protein [Ignavibacteria bacterium]HRJ86815.1 BNR-repeat neuraminidase N-terminal domain-containing protein [Ignavibacteria bacterium]